ISAFRRCSGMCGETFPNCVWRFCRPPTGAVGRLAERISSLSSHDHYEELCVLAATGQISPSQWSDLEAHVAHCPDCGHTLRDFNAVAMELTKGGFERDSTEGIPDGMIERVAERVGLQTSTSSEGSNGSHSPDLRLSTSQRPVVRVKPRSRSVLRQYVLTAAIAFVVIAAFFLGARWERHRFQSDGLSGRDAIEADRESSHTIGGEVEQLRNQLQSMGAREAQLSALLHQREQDIGASRQKQADLEARIAVLQRASTEVGQKRTNDNDELS